MAGTSGRKAVLVSKKNAQQTRLILESLGVWDSSRKLKIIGEDNVAIPILTNYVNEEDWENLHRSLTFPEFCENEFKVIEVDLPSSKKSMLKTPYLKMVEALQDLVKLSGEEFCSAYLPSVPNHWEIHDDLVLLPSESFQNEVWKTYGINVWKTVAHCLSCNRVARKHRIEQDGFRSPRVDLLLGDNGWVQHTDNGIKYSYDVTRCMYSCGNIPEKLRVAKFSCIGETVVDLYAGIGYFTLPFLVHAKAEMVHACEWNPVAADALEKNLIINGVFEKCVIHLGDNKQFCPCGIADRVNLGLIPSSEEGWTIACRALKPSGGILHIHSNVSSLPQTPGDTRMNSAVLSDDTDLIIRHSHSQEGHIAQKQHTTRSDISVFPNDSKFSASKEIGSDHRLEDKFSDVSTLKKAEEFWNKWAQQTSITILNMLEFQHGSKWYTKILSLNHVKSYAPHIDHLVLDLECKPCAL